MALIIHLTSFQLASCPQKAAFSNNQFIVHHSSFIIFFPFFAPILKPHIVIELERLRNPWSGLGQFCVHLGREILVAGEQSDDRYTLLAPPASEQYFGHGADMIQVKPKYKWFPPDLKADVWHCTHQDSQYLPRNSKTALLLTIHDLNFLERTDYPDWKKRLKLWQLQRRINRAQGLAYISRFAQEWAHAHLLIRQGTLEKVIYNGNNLDLTIAPAMRPEWMTEQPFFFSIGIHPKKNYHSLLAALAAFPQYRWIIAGADSRHYQQQLKDTARALHVDHQLVITGPVSESEKNGLLAHCSGLLFPSLSEGFGLPVVEAMAMGKPVFLSRRTSLPEIGGPEAFYFDNETTEGVIQTIREGLANFANDPSKTARIKAHAAQFSWQKAASEYIQLYHELSAG